MPRKPKNLNRGLRWGGRSVRPRGSRWEARWLDGDVHRSKMFDTEQEGWDHLLDIDRGRVSASPSTLAVTDLIDHLIDHADGRLTTGTIYCHRTHANQLIVPRIGKRRAAELGPYDIQKWVDGLKPTYRPSSIRLAIAILSTAYARARRFRLMQDKPVVGGRRPVIPRKTPAVWSIEETRAVLRHVQGDPFYGALYPVALLTGMRPGELRGLRWDAVDLDAGTILVYATLAHDKNGRTIWQPQTKGHEPRMLDLPWTVRDVLLDHRKLRRERRRTAETWHDLGIVFDRGDGRWLDQQTWRRFHYQMCADIDVAPILLHGLRHPSATFDLDANPHDKIVSERLGHKDPAFTARFYQHVRPPIRSNAANALAERFMGPESSGPNPHVSFRRSAPPRRSTRPTNAPRRPRRAHR